MPSTDGLLLDLLVRLSREVDASPTLETVLSGACYGISRLLGGVPTAARIRCPGTGTCSVALPESASDLLDLAERPAVERRGLLVLPVSHAEGVDGLIVAASPEGDPAAVDRQLHRAELLAEQVGLWCASVQRLERERRVTPRAEISESSYRELLELAPDAILIVDPDGRIRMVNGQAEALFGYPRDQLLGREVEMLVPPALRDRHRDHRGRYAQNPLTRPMGIGMDLLACRSDGTQVPVEISLSPLRDQEAGSVISVVRDVTARKDAERERQRLLESERRKSEQLKLAYREAHHRIKNNLQAISDLIYLELGAESSPATQCLLRDCVERIQSIALVHDLLSQDSDVQTVDTRALAERLIPMLLAGNGLTPESLALDVHVPHVPLSSRRATTLALILCELVSNAAKHGLSSATPRLSVTLNESDEGLRLTVSDNGPGLPPGFDAERDARVGLQVVRTLAERDLDGVLSFESRGGLIASVWFPW